jgi:hypothetical protein
MRFDADHDRGLLRPRHWDFVDYDPYHRPFFFNPLDNDVSFRYFYGGGYRTVFVPAGGRVLIDAADAGVFPFTVAAADLAAAGANAAADAALLGVGNFLGGAFIPPNGYDGPPPPDYQPFTPVSYDQVPVYFAGPGRTAAVDHVTVVGHDEAAPAGMQDVFQLDNGTLARGQITQSPDAGTPAITVQATQTLPGISSWDDGRQYVDAQVAPVAKVSPSGMSWWLLSGAAAVLATICGIGVWVWRRFQRAGQSHEAAIGWASERHIDAGLEGSRTPVETG